jgi:hypothetical protein
MTNRFFPPIRILHPQPLHRFDARSGIEEAFVNVCNRSSIDWLTLRAEVQATGRRSPGGAIHKSVRPSLYAPRCESDRRALRG